MPRLLAALLLLPVVSVHAGNGWFCAEDASTGFKWINGRWTPQHFKATDKYVVALATQEDRDMQTKLRANGVALDIQKYVVKLSGNSTPIHWNCQQTSVGLYCDNGDFVVSTKTLRFTTKSDTDFWSDSEATRSKYALTYSVGTCTPF